MWFNRRRAGLMARLVEMTWPVKRAMSRVGIGWGRPSRSDDIFNKREAVCCRALTLLAGMEHVIEDVFHMMPRHANVWAGWSSPFSIFS